MVGAVHTHTHTHTQLNLTNGLTVGASIARPQEVGNLSSYSRVANCATLFLMVKNRVGVRIVSALGNRNYLSCNRVRDG